MTVNPTPRLAVVGALAATVLALSACAAEPEPVATADASEPTTLRVSTLGLCDEVIVWGLDQGIFAEHGLNVELTTVQTGAAGIAAIQAGEIDIAFANPLSSLQAIREGVPLQIVSGTGLSTEESNEVIVAADSEFQSAEDLQSATIALNALGGLAHILTEAWIAEEAGADSTAEFVTLPFADQVPSVASGAVDSAEVAASQAITAHEEGTVRSLGNPFYDNIGEIPTAFYVSGSEFVAENEDAVAAFAEAMTEVAASANDEANDEARHEVIAEACQSTPEVLAVTPEAKYEGQLDMTAFGSLIDVLTAYDAIGQVDTDAIVPEFARAD